ncbi:MAG: Fic family protein, partial [Clostridiales bacterium]|nr:Fic family protein [Clostridiales bacterium]
MDNRAGKEITNFSGEAAYKSFLPAPLPPNPPLELDTEGLRLLVSANKQLGI